MGILIRIKERIIGVYTHDGPGFKDEVFTSEKYRRIRDRIHKTLPQSSLVGMLLHNQEDYLVVESKQFWFMQHDPFYWVVKENDFKYAQGITQGAEHINKVINQWISSIDEDKRELFVTTLYSVIESLGIVNYTELTEDWLKKAAMAIRNIRGIDKETRRFVNKTIKALLELYLKTLPKPKPLKIAERHTR